MAEPATDFRFAAARNTAAFTCKHLWADRRPILRVSHDPGGDWQFLCDADHSESPPSECALVCLEDVVRHDPSVNEVALMCEGHVATRDSPASPWQIVDETPEHIRSVIDEHGWWVGLIGGDDEGPGFAYTIGLYEKFDHPELIVFGLPPEAMHGILNRCGDMIREGTRFAPGAPVADVLDDYDVRFRRVTAEKSYEEYLGYGCNHYGERTFPVLQLVWPDKEHRFPGDAEAAAFLSERQPLLD